ncbi:hypothetical protein Sjap_015855 [Stephania japonica]|uniref:Uncharacterized protein n=1 Tax=Stephania japonica TaxID=461633 RepID=A0AAP0IK20_9MAGN
MMKARWVGRRAGALILKKKLKNWPKHGVLQGGSVALDVPRDTLDAGDHSS